MSSNGHRNKLYRIVSVTLIALFLASSLSIAASASDTFDTKRLTSDYTYDEVVSNSASNALATVGLSVHVFEYDELFYSDGVDALKLKITTAASTRNSFSKDPYYDYFGVNHYSFEGFNDINYIWVDPATQQETGITTDNTGTWITLDYPFTFYGEAYRSVYVSANGYVCLDKYSISASPTPQPIPSASAPNTLIAAFWTGLQLLPSCQIYYSKGIAGPTGDPYYQFAVTWDAVKDTASGMTHTFQIILRQRVYTDPTLHHTLGDVIICYKDVKPDSIPSLTIGIEDQTGSRGIKDIYDYDQSGHPLVTNYRPKNNDVLLFRSFWQGVDLLSLKLKFEKSPYDGYQAGWLDLQEARGGYNVQLATQEKLDPTGEIFKYGVKFLIGQMERIPYVGLLIKGMRMMGEFAQQWGKETMNPLFTIDVNDHFEPEKQLDYDKQWMTATAPCILFDSDAKFLTDASAGFWFIWKFNEAYRQVPDIDHGLKITVEVAYVEHAFYEDVYGTVSTTCTLSSSAPTAPSSVSITSPSSGQTFYTSANSMPVTVHVAATSDPLFPVSSVEIGIDGTWYPATSEGGNNWYRTFDLSSGGGQGTRHDISARATNEAGTILATPIFVNVVKAPPIPPPTVTCDKSSVTYVMETDPVYVTWTPSGGSPTTYTITGPKGTTSGTWQSGVGIQYNVGGLGHTTTRPTTLTYYFTFTAYNAYGQSTSNTVTVYVKCYNWN